MNVHILGSAGWIPGKNETSCFLVECNDSLIMLDMGTGVANLSKYESLLKKYDEISIILSHYHLDHVIGIIYLLPYVKDKKVNIYGPSKPYYDKSAQEYLEQLLGNQFFSRPLLKIAKQVNCFNYNTDGFFVNGVPITVKLQQHSAPSFQITIDNKLIYSTDTAFDIDLFSNIEPGSVLLHECWDISASGNSPRKHSILSEIVDGVKELPLSKVVLIHLNPEWDMTQYKLIKAAILGSVIVLGADGETIHIK